MPWKVVHHKYDEDEEITDTFSACDDPWVSREGFPIHWYHSTRKRELDVAARRHRLERSLVALADLKRRISSPRSRLRDPSRVRSAVDKILEENRTQDLIRIDIGESEIPHFRQKRPGRPGKSTEYRKEVRVRPSLHYEPDQDQILEEARDDGTFPLITNDRGLSSLEVLLAYKDQARVEKRFRDLKTDFAMAPVFLKKVERIEAFLCTYFLALLVGALLERELRLAMGKKKIAALSLYPEGKPCRAPTTRKLVDAFDDVQRHEILGASDVAGEPMVTELSTLQQRILKLLHVPESSYQAPPSRGSSRR